MVYRLNPDLGNPMFYGASSKIFEKAKILRNKMTRSEKTMWHHIKGKSLGVKFRRQPPVNNYIVDFYCHEFKLVIEVDGEIHLKSENKEYDFGRTQVLQEFGLRIIRFTNSEVINNTESVLRKLQLLIEQFRDES